MISKGDIEGLAKLARLKLSDTELVELQTDVSNILEYVGQVTEVINDSVTPVIPPHHNNFRVDQLRDLDDPLVNKAEALRKQFPSREGNYNVVRKIIQKDE